MEFEHKPVLLNETIDNLHVKPEGTYVDGTLGGGGHAYEVAKRLSPQGRFIGIDQDADAIVLAYMGSGLDLDPTQRSEKSGNMGSYNANVVAAIDLMFGDGTFSGTLPVQIPEITEREDGSAAYSDQVLYERGFGLQ